MKEIILEISIEILALWEDFHSEAISPSVSKLAKIEIAINKNPRTVRDFFRQNFNRLKALLPQLKSD
jgi:hypothetical protein